MILKEFECSCGKYFEEAVDMNDSQCKCPDCGGLADRTYRHAPIVKGADSFNPHYDDQVGLWFESAEHKKKVLKDNGFEQVSGPASPRKSNKTSIKMNKEQAKQFDPGLKARMPVT